MWPFSKSVSDRVNDALWQQPLLKDLGLKVSGSGDMVSVSGNVPDASYVDLITSVAQGINGVSTVDTSGVSYEIATEEPAQAAPDAPAASVSTPATSAPKAAPKVTPAQVQEAVETSKIAKAVLHAIRGHGEVSDDPIDVLQSGKSVILRGVVDNDHELRLLTQLATAVSGVQGVDTSGVRVAQGAKELTKEKDKESGDTVYTVKPGDTLSAIAEKYFGDAMEYKKIAHYNNISNPDMIHPGDKLRIPG